MRGVTELGLAKSSGGWSIPRIDGGIGGIGGIGAFSRSFTDPLAHLLKDRPLVLGCAQALLELSKVFQREGVFDGFL